MFICYVHTASVRRYTTLWNAIVQQCVLVYRRNRLYARRCIQVRRRSTSQPWTVCDYVFSGKLRSINKRVNDRRFKKSISRERSTLFLTTRPNDQELKRPVMGFLNAELHNPPSNVFFGFRASVTARRGLARGMPMPTDGNLTAAADHHL